MAVLRESEATVVLWDRVDNNQRLGLGFLFHVAWMKGVAGAYLAFLWLPITPEKIVTVAITILLLRVLFPKDEKTLGALRGILAKLKQSFKKK